MAKPPRTPPNEPERLHALRRLDLLDAEAEADPAYQSLVELAAELLGTAGAAINLIDADRQWTLAGVGIDHGDTAPRAVSMCAHAIVEAPDGEPYVLDDAISDPDFNDGPFVTSGTVGFYAGAPVTTAAGDRVGTLCVFDPAPRTLDATQRRTLVTLAGAVSAHVEVRRQALLAAERHAELLAVLEHAPDAFARLDAGGRVLAVNARTESLLGAPREALLDRPATDAVSGALEVARLRLALHRAADDHSAGLPASPFELDARRADGTPLPIEVTIGATDTPRGLRFNVFMRDITERLERRREREEEIEGLAILAEVTSRLASGLDDATVRDQLCHAAVKVAGGAGALLLVTAPDDEDALIVTGTTDPDGRGARIEPETHSLALAAYRSRETRFAADTAAEGWAAAAERGVRSAVMQPVVLDGRCLGVLAVLWTETRAALGTRTERLLSLLAHEASTAFARTALFARLAEQSRTDALTGVLNRRALDDELHLALLNARRDDAAVSVAVLDLDRFKAYNDTYGHTAGDTLLKGACAAWGDTLRAGDVLARFGGEEFVVVLPGCAAGDASTLIDRLRTVTPNGQTCSAGVATWDGAEAVGDLLERADQALYRAKDAGRDQVCTA